MYFKKCLKSEIFSHYFAAIIGCNGDPNAKRKECASPCPRTCANMNAGPIKCPRICIINGCDCNPGYVLDHIKGKCILPTKCRKCNRNRFFNNHSITQRFGRQQLAAHATRQHVIKKLP